MAVSQAVQNAFHGKARTAGEYFDIESDADDFVRKCKAEGKGNPRKARYHDYTKQDGTKVYKWVVRHNS